VLLVTDEARSDSHAAMEDMEESNSLKNDSGRIILGRRSLQWTVVFVGCGLVWILFLPAFVIGNVYSIRAASSGLATVVAKGKRSLLALWVSLILFFLGSLIIAPTIKTVAGVYIGKFHGLTERLELRQDGTFTQHLTLLSGNDLKTEGTWTVKGQAVSLGSYWYFIDEMNHGPLVTPKLYSGVTFVYSPGLLVIDWDSGYYTLTRR
jgi:hypothetical protein